MNYVAEVPALLVHSGRKSVEHLGRKWVVHYRAKLDNLSHNQTSMPSSPSSPSSQRGFTAVPRILFDRVLCLDLTKRELIVLLLIIRLTYGVRNVAWVCLRQTDLAVVGISASHAKATMESLLKRGAVTFDGDRKAYQITRGFVSGVENRKEVETKRGAHLARLVAHQLTLTSEVSRQGVPKTESRILPEQERNISRKGKVSEADAREFSRTRQGFVKACEVAKNRERQI